MRVITGSARGKKLKVPDGPDIRPITDFIKEALFNAIGPYLNGLSFLDVFAGSGAVGIEALSRGAESVVFVEINRSAAQVIKENLINCRLENRAQIINGDAFKILPRLSREGRKFDVIYVDPPFRKTDYYSRVMKLLPPLVDKKGICIIRTPKNFIMPDQEVEGMVKDKVSTYGDSVLNYYINCR